MGLAKELSGFFEKLHQRIANTGDLMKEWVYDG
jgi:hypothetical protein